MATKAKKTQDGIDDLLGGTPSDDLLGGTPAKAKSKAKPKAAAAAKQPKAETAKAPKAPKEPKAAAESVTRGPKGSGKFYIDPDEFAALQKKVGTLKKATSSREIAEKFEIPTWKARLAAVALVKAGKGTLAKAGTTLTYTP